jgi:hypothetical protein
MSGAEREVGGQPHWFTDQELEAMARPTMDRAIEALERGDAEEARRLCEEMKGEGQVVHDLMVELIAGLITFVHDRVGEDAVEEAWTEVMERSWKRDAEKIERSDRRQIAEAIAATWRAHSTSGVGPHAGSFTVEEDDEKLTFRMNPCGTGQKLWKRGFYEGDNPLALTERAHDWSYGRKDFPIYCTHCPLMNQLLPVKWFGHELYPSQPPADFDKDPCTWHWYKQAPEPAS